MTGHLINTEESIYSRRRRRRRRGENEIRSSKWVSALFVLFWAQPPSVHAFHSPSTLQQASIIPRKSSFRYSSAVYLVKEGVQSSIELSSQSTPKTNGNRAEGDLPPWLSTRQSSQITISSVEEELDDLEWKLLDRRILSRPSDITKAIYIASSGEPTLMMGIIDFLKLFLAVEESAGDSIAGFVSQEVLLASIIHYVECVAARKEGIYSRLRQALLVNGKAAKKAKSILTLPPSKSIEASTVELGDTSELLESPSTKNGKSGRLAKSSIQSDDSSAELDFFSEEVFQLAKDASHIKRAEILTDIFLSGTVDYERVQDMLVSVSGEDWRALAIRCVASLYRLEGSLTHEKMLVDKSTRQLSEQNVRNRDTINSARNAIKIYAGLSQRMGMYALKSKLESRGFEILYPRQYRVTKALFTQRMHSLQAVSMYLKQQVTQILENDSSLMSQVDDLQIICRVKEPFSAWKKLLRTTASEGAPDRELRPLRPTQASTRQLSLLSVQDIVALRVIVSARPLFEEEDRDQIRSREQLLCYYIHRVIRSVYPETSPDRVKDYIRQPKPNGYQSLHHTSFIGMDNKKIPIEIQVRSHEMNAIAEFGVAAHWNYKQKQSLALTKSKPSSLLPSSTRPMKKSKSKKENVVDVIVAPSSDDVPTLSPYLKALDSARRALVESSVFCFLVGSTNSDLEHGQLVAIKKGSSVRKILSGLKESFDGNVSEDATYAIYRNGKVAQWDEVVSNGDVLLFLQDDTPVPTMSSERVLSETSIL